MKRQLFILLSLIFIMTANSFSAFADDAPTFSASDVSGKPGDEVAVAITCSGNPGITAWKVDISYDNSVMSLTDCNQNCDFSGVLGSQTLQAMPYVISWMDGTADVTTSGKMAELKFKINDTAAPGEYKVSLSYDEDNVYNLSETNIKFALTDGTVLVSGEAAPTPEKDSEISEPVSPAEENSEPTSSKAESFKPVSSKAESSKPDSSKAESSKPDSSKAESSTLTSSKTESSKPDSSKAESSKPDSSKAESSKPASSKTESSKPASSKAESSKPESAEVSSSAAGNTGTETESKALESANASAMSPDNAQTISETSVDETNAPKASGKVIIAILIVFAILAVSVFFVIKKKTDNAE